jgi:ribonuclease HII
MKYMVGIDEVGRGPLAGPVTVGVVCVPAPFTWRHVPAGLRDSKQLTEKARERWYAWVRTQPTIRYAVVSVSAREIDRVGITAAANKAANRALRKLGLSPSAASIRLDHGLAVDVAWKQHSYVKGDERFPEIALASIMAKVTRDAYMVRVAKRYPQYGFDKHKGYGTLSHREAIKQCGLSPLHRKKFCSGILRT